MDINFVNRPWHAIAGGLTKLLSFETRKKAVLLLNKTSLHVFNKFSSWPCLNHRHFCFLACDLEIQDIDFKLLEQFMVHALPKDLSYKSFISLHLQHECIDSQSALNMKRDLALKELKALVSATLFDIKMIEMHHIAQSKG